MGERSLGNSSSSLHSYLVVEHTRAWMARSMRFMAIYRMFEMPGVTVPPLPAVPEMEPVPTSQWILSAFATESFSRLGEMRAKVTSIFGSVLKMDSTKKVECSQTF